MNQFTHRLARTPRQASSPDRDLPEQADKPMTYFFMRLKGEGERRRWHGIKIVQDEVFG
jgi:hypothetical protein